MKKSYLYLLSFLLTMSSHASDVPSTKISEVLAGPHYNKNVILTVSTKATELPLCQTNPRYSYVFDGTTQEGKITLSIVLAAYAAQKDVWIRGKGTCSLYDGIEDLAHIVAK